MFLEKMFSYPESEVVVHAHLVLPRVRVKEDREAEEGAGAVGLLQLHHLLLRGRGTVATVRVARIGVVSRGRPLPPSPPLPPPPLLGF